LGAVASRRVNIAYGKGWGSLATCGGLVTRPWSFYIFHLVCFDSITPSGGLPTAD
jgi:hypothetical protein